MRKKSIIAAFIGLMIGIIGVYYFEFIDQSSTLTVNETKTIPVKDINKINLESVASSVHFYPSTSNTLMVHLKGKTSRKDLLFSLDKKGDSAMIKVGLKDNQLFHFSLFMNDALQADVEVPQKVYRELYGHSSAGSIEIQQISAASFDLSSSAGSIKAEDLKGDVTAHSSAGSIKLTNVEGNLNLTDSAGSIDINLDKITKNITAHSSAGSVRVMTKSMPKALQLNLQTSAGSADVNLPNVSYLTKEHDHVIGSIGTGGPKVQLESSAGSVSITK